MSAYLCTDEYQMLRTREAYNETVFLRHDQEAIKRAEDRLRKQAAKLGFQIIPQHQSEAGLVCSWGAAYSEMYGPPLGRKRNLRV